MQVSAFPVSVIYYVIYYAIEHLRISRFSAKKMALRLKSELCPVAHKKKSGPVNS